MVGSLFGLRFLSILNLMGTMKLNGSTDFEQKEALLFSFGTDQAILKLAWFQAFEDTF